MERKIALFFILILLPILSQSQSIPDAPPKASDDNLPGCAFIVGTCQNRCGTEPHSFVRWTVSVIPGGSSNGPQTDVQCELINQASTGRSTAGVANPLVNVFDVPCCPIRDSNTSCPTVTCPTLPPARPDTSCPRCPDVPECSAEKECPDFLPEQSGTNVPNVCLDDERLHTLLILGVTTLTSILLMCMFILLGLVFYRKKNRTYRLDGSSEENHSLSKEKKTPGASLTIFGMCCESAGSDCSQENNTPSTSSQNLPPNYAKTTNNEQKANNQSGYENTEQVGCNAAERKRLSMQEYVNQEDLKNLMSNPNIPRSIQVKKDNFEMGEMGTANGQIPSSNKPAVPAGDFEIRGGFIQPKRTSEKSDTQNPRFVESEDQTGDLSLSDDIALHFEANKKMSLFSETSEPDENPYVEAPPTPPIKSPRNQTKFESPDAYQTLMTSNSNQSVDPNEYNLLIHNTSVANNDMKALLFMNNNSHQQAKNNHKTEVTLKPSPNIATASEA